MERQCGKCKGQRGRYRENRNKPVGLASWYTSSQEWIKCDVCSGSGVNPNYREKTCERCSRTIGYHKDAQYPPRYCANCKPAVAAEKEAKQRQREQQASMWREKSCPGVLGYCGNTIKYRTDWSNIPDLCQKCKDEKKARRDSWLEKACATPNCSNVIKYKKEWEHPPSFCADCKTKRERVKGKQMLESGGVLPGSGRTVGNLGCTHATLSGPNRYGGQHVTVYNRNLGHHEHYSYDTDIDGNYVRGSAHMTDAMTKVLRDNGHTNW
ncbi:hypothetical protein KBC79_06435 [Candidatus Woesebacteria bacterium]|nr:hypothetical protein [Candidatus Woesebacteria bacterium]